MNQPFLDIESLKTWFLNEQRDLPWRQQPTPYGVWISEVMLQQTQVAVVIPYFLRWMQRFPTIKDLAEAHLDEVIKQWEGLGYYSRARCLHEGARYIMEHFGGQLPNNEAHLKQIKGLGPYTIGAILSFAFHQKKAAVDGNVLRVLSRYFCLKDDIAKPATVKKMRVLVEQILPEKEPWIVNEALIELGATICQRKAQCKRCPLQQTCLAYRHQCVDELPIKTKAVKTTYLYRAVVLIRCQNFILVKRGQKGQIMSDLHEFPFFEASIEGLPVDQLIQHIQTTYALNVQAVQTLPELSQSFTRYQARLNPVLFNCDCLSPVEGLSWVAVADLKQLAFSSGHRRILTAFLSLHSEVVC